MAILTPDYERMQNGQPQDYNTTKQYRKEFADQDIASAQALITNDNNYLVMDAGKLDDLCDTINYMQEIWERHKRLFASRYLSLTSIEQYDSEHGVYTSGDLVLYDGTPYICIDNEGTAGAWDGSKWSVMERDDVGLTFIGWSNYGALHGDDTLWINYESLTATQPPLRWKVGDDLIDYGYTYPNIRYLKSNQTPYTGEIYMTDWNGGE